MKKYYRADNAGRPISGVQFHVYDIVAGTACGVYATVDSATISTLNKLVTSKRITAIDAEEYELCSKKNHASSNGWTPLSVNTPPPLPVNSAIKGTGVVTVGKAEAAEEPLPPVVEITAQLASVEDALALSEPTTPAASAAAPAIEDVAPAKRNRR